MKRKLRPTVRTTLEIIFLIQLMLICSLAHLEIEFAPWVLGFVALFGLNAHVLEKYS